MVINSLVDYTSFLDIIYNIKQRPEYANSTTEELVKQLSVFIDNGGPLPDHIQTKHSDFKSGRDLRFHLFAVPKTLDATTLSRIGFITSELNYYIATVKDEDKLIFPKEVFRKSLSNVLADPVKHPPLHPAVASKLEQLTSENENLKKELAALKEQTPSLLGKFRKDDPLLLAIQIRNKEWSNYNPENDRSTRANREAIVTELTEKGIVKRTAEAIELVACPIDRNPSKE